MPIIPINRLSPGMVLKSPVRDITGRLLLGAEVELQEKHINIFKTWGIAEVEVQGDGEEETGQGDGAQVDEAALARARDEMNVIFSFNDLGRSSVMREVFRLSVLNKAGALGQAGHAD
jgi:hypothetical protein